MSGGSDVSVALRRRCRRGLMRRQSGATQQSRPAGSSGASLWRAARCGGGSRSKGCSGMEETRLGDLAAIPMLHRDTSERSSIGASSRMCWSRT